MFPISVRFVLLFNILSFCLPLQATAEKKLTIYTVNYPLQYFAERIGGNQVNVIFPAPANLDPAFWKPNEATVREYQKADLIILNGAGYAKWTEKVSLPMLRMVDTSAAFKSNLINLDTNVTHSHGPGGDHSHGGTAFTTWLDFSQAKLQAEAIFKALSRKLPARTAVFAQNFEMLKKDLLELDAEMEAMSASKPGLPLFGSHPIYQYMARRYDLNLKMLMWEPDDDPGEAQWKYFQGLVQDHKAVWMVWEGEPLQQSSRNLKERGIQSQVFAPCFNRPDKGDFLSVMQQNLNNMATVFIK
jgi:zinc transport system substrate-binding protein